VSQSVRRAAAAIKWSKRNKPVVPGEVATMRRATSPAEAMDSRVASSSSGSGWTNRGPGLGEGALDVADRRAAHFDAGVAPGLNAPLGFAGPEMIDTES
jgi:hypothetical protein